MSTAAAVTPTGVAADPSWFPESFDSQRGEIGLVQTDKADLSTQTFLDHRWQRNGARRIRVRPEALRQERGESYSLAMIWHTGFCCSTLLAKALDSERVLSLCEPQILPEIADAGREGVFARSAILRGIPRLVLDLLARPFRADGAIVVKAAPSANVLLPEVARRPNTRNLFLYCDCRSFLISVAKLGEEGRKYTRRMFLNIVGDGHTQFQWSPAKLFQLSDLEIAALIWHMQVAEFRRTMPLLGVNMMSLDCDALLAQPEATLKAVARHFNLPATDLPSANTMFTQNAKVPGEKYDSAMRRSHHAEIARQLGSDLDRIVEWSYGVSGATPRGLPLPNPLLETGKMYP